MTVAGRGVEQAHPGPKPSSSRVVTIRPSGSTSYDDWSGTQRGWPKSRSSGASATGSPAAAGEVERVEVAPARTGRRGTPAGRRRASAAARPTRRPRPPRPARRAGRRPRRPTRPRARCRPRTCSGGPTAARRSAGRPATAPGRGRSRARRRPRRRLPSASASTGRRLPATSSTPKSSLGPSRSMRTSEVTGSTDASRWSSRRQNATPRAASMRKHDQRTRPSQSGRDRSRLADRRHRRHRSETSTRWTRWSAKSTYSASAVARRARPPRPRRRRTRGTPCARSPRPGTRRPARPDSAPHQRQPTGVARPRLEPPHRGAGDDRRGPARSRR